VEVRRSAWLWALAGLVGLALAAVFHVWVPADWTISEAHERMDRVEEELQHRFPGTEILMHLDPEGHTDRETLLPPEITEKAS